MGRRRRRVIRQAEARHALRRDYLSRFEAAHDAELELWRTAVFAAARSLARGLPEHAGDDAAVLIDAGGRRWWRLFRRDPPIVGWQVAAFKFWEADPEGKAVPAYAPGSVSVDVYGRWIAEIGRAEWLVIQADPAHLASFVPGDTVVEALAAGVPELADRYWISIPEIPPEPD